MNTKSINGFDSFLLHLFGNYRTMEISGNTLEQHIHRTCKHMRDNTNTKIAHTFTYNMYLLRSPIYTIISKEQ